MDSTVMHTKSGGTYPEHLEVFRNQGESVRYAQIGAIASHFQHIARVCRYSFPCHFALLAGTKNVKKYSWRTIRCYKARVGQTMAG